MNLRSFSVRIYYFMRKSYPTFRVIIFLKEIGFNRLVKTIMENGGVSSENQYNQNTMIFIRKNKKRIKAMLALLEDEKSRKVWKAAMMCRAKGLRMPSKLWSDTDQYFVKNIINIQNDEVFVDGGAFIGDTIQHLFNIRKNKIKKVIAFEPDPDNLLLLKKYFSRDKRVCIIEKGLSSKTGFLSFQENGSGSRIVTEEINQPNLVKIPVTNIDSVKECKNATFIKLDIEGAEMSALQGAEKTILKNKPKLAICLYHSDDDMVRIIEYIHNIVPEYKLYVRHHASNDTETVLYAVV